MIKLFGAKLRCAKCLGVYLVSFGCLYKFVFQIDRVGKRRKEICGSRKCSVFPCGSSLVGECNPCAMSCIFLLYLTL